MTWKNAPSVGRHKLWALGLAIVVLAAPGICSAEEITIEVAPATLNLQSNGNVVTVHTDVSYNDVNVGTVYLGGVAIDHGACIIEKHLTLPDSEPGPIKVIS